ncbi:MAG: PHP domain-containing protein, partial [Planctomycetes bacterium]|nr:PHP domain-containing protein [Planctomycetota bacterium]
MKFDLHMHTARHSPDADSDPFELVRAAIKAGLDGIVITEHDFLWPEDELQELRASAPELVILAGVEVTGRGGDVLCYGVTTPSAIPRGTEWGPLTREVHRQGGACVAAHPNRWNQPFEKLLKEQQPELDGIEVMSNNMDPDLRAKAALLLEKYPHFAQLGNSDSHQPWSVGCCYTEFAVE